MKPYYDQDGITIYHGDCREVLPQLDVKVDLAVADFPFKQSTALAEIVADETYLKLNDCGNLLVIDNPFNLFLITKYFQRFILRNGIALIRTQEFAPAQHLAMRHNYALMLCKDKEASKCNWGGNKTNNTHATESDVWQDWVAGYRKGADIHPEAIPYKYAVRFIELLCANRGTILDCFVGAGTFGKAAKVLGIKYIGIEIEEKYCEIAVKRLAQSVMRLE